VVALDRSILALADGLMRGVAVERAGGRRGRVRLRDVAVVGTAAQDRDRRVDVRLVGRRRGVGILIGRVVVRTGLVLVDRTGTGPAAPAGHSVALQVGVLVLADRLAGPVQVAGRGGRVGVVALVH